MHEKAPHESSATIHVYRLLLTIIEFTENVFTLNTKVSVCCDFAAMAAVSVVELY